MTQLIVLSVLLKKSFKNKGKNKTKKKDFVLRDECIPTMFYFFLLSLTTLFIVKKRFIL